MRQSPIERLPVELLSQVFLLATHGQEGVACKKKDPALPHGAEDNSENPLPRLGDVVGDELRTPIQKTYPPLDVSSQSSTCPLHLSSVCRRWRGIALSEPTLWTTIVTTGDDVLDGIPDVRGLQMFLSRARHAPLDILVDLRDTEWDFCDPYPLDGLRESHARAALSLLLPHLHHWRSFAILTDTFTPMHTALSLLSSLPPSVNPDVSSAPLLESLILMRCNEYACHTTEFHPPHLKNPYFAPFITTSLPRLQNLQLIGTHVAWPSLLRILPQAVTELPTDGLRSLEISYSHHSVYPTPLQLRTILRACPNLDRLALKLSVPEHDPGDYVSSTKVELLHLTELSITYGAAVDAASFIATLSAPSIIHLELEDGAHPAETTVEDASLLLYTIAGRSASRPPQCPGGVFPCVRSAILRGMQARAHAFAAFFRSLNELRSLEIEDATPEAVVGLMPDTTGLVPCTKLNYLQVRGCPDAMVPAYHMSGARAEADAAILDVHINPADMSPDASVASDLDEADADARRAIYGDDASGDGEDWDGSDTEELTTPEPGAGPVVAMPAMIHVPWTAEADPVLGTWLKAHTAICPPRVSVDSKAM